MGPPAALLELGLRSRSLRSILLVSLLALLLGAPVLAVFRLEALAAVPFERLGGPLALVVTIAVGRMVEGRGRRMPRVLPALLVVGCLFGLLAPPSLASARRELSQRRTTLRLMLAALDQLTDIDRDGTSGAYAGRDCAPFDRTRGPDAREVAGDGVDQDCSGFDLSVEAAAVKRGSPRHDVRSPRLQSRPNILLVTTDGLSFRHSSPGGYERPVTPHLVDFARRSVTFESAFSTSSSTGNALPALFTGRWPVESPGLMPRYNRVAEMDGRTPLLASVHPRGHHDDSLRSEETHVPLLVQGPLERGTRRRGLATHLDLVPTLLDLAGLPTVPHLRGESLAPVLLTGAEPEKSVAMAMLWQPRGGPFGAPPLRSLSIRTSELVLLDDRERSATGLFAWRDDPLEDHDLLAHRGEDAEWMRHVLALEMTPVMQE